MKIEEFKNIDASYTMPDESDFLRGLRKINIFVGANNSGKSRFLRQIFNANEDNMVFPLKGSKMSIYDIRDKLRGIYERLRDLTENNFSMTDLRPLTLDITGDYANRFNQFLNKIQNTTRSQGRRKKDGAQIWDDEVANLIKGEVIKEELFKNLAGVAVGNLKSIYIPMLRGLRPLREGEEGELDIYSSRTSIDYALTRESEKKSIFSGLTVYPEAKKMILGSKEGREAIREFEKFISETFFNKKEVTLIPDYDTENLKLNIDNVEKDRAMFELGDGLQAILIMTFKIFLQKNKDIALFIEEPEMMMHPGMQRILIESLVSKFDKLQVFLTTHSNHFLDLIYDYPDDVAIFSFEEAGKEEFKISNIGGNAGILDLLGVRNSSVFLANCVVWTEGVTDRMILRKLLEVDESFDYKEDYHYAFAEYGGGNLENFDFIDEDSRSKARVSSLSKKNLIVIDNDNDGEHTKKFKRRMRLKEYLGKDAIFDDHIEIENLIPYEIWVRVVEKICADSPSKKIKLKENIKPAVKDKFDSLLSSKKIGTLLAGLVEPKKQGDEIGYLQNKDATHLGETKKVIAKYIVETIDEMNWKIDDFPELTRDIVGRIKEFVMQAN